MKNRLFLLAAIGMLAAVALASCSKQLGGNNDDNGGNGNGNGDGDGNGNEKVELFSFSLTGKTSGSITVKIEPSDPELQYYWCSIPEKTFKEKYSSDKEAAVDYLVRMMKSTYADLGYASFEEMYENIISKGPDETEFKGYDAETPVLCLAFGLDVYGVVTSDIYVSERFVTDAVKPSDNTFRIEIEDTIVRVYPSNDDTYCFGLFPESVFAEYATDEEFAQSYIEANKEAMNLLAHSGDAFFDHYETFKKNGPGKYYAFAFGYESGKQTTPVTKLEVIKEGPEDPLDGDPFSKLSGSVNLTCGDAYYENGDLDCENAESYFLALQVEDDFAYMETRITMYVLTEKGSGFPAAGEYTINSSKEAGTIIRGGTNEDGIFGSIYYEMGSYSPDASLDSGSMTIADNGDGTFTITLRAKDMNGNEINADYNGKITFYEE